MLAQRTPGLAWLSDHLDIRIEQAFQFLLYLDGHGSEAILILVKVSDRKATTDIENFQGQLLKLSLIEYH